MALSFVSTSHSEEYGANNVLSQKYLQGYHGLVKTFVGTPVYYYQDELGSTSHIASSTGSLLEYYKYDLYGKPKIYNTSNAQLTTSAYGVKDLFTGQRWVSEIGLYDDRNRFMSPDLGRFLQPDPIGFKGDGSNLYRYCGNDWVNRSDPMGLDDLNLYKPGSPEAIRADKAPIIPRAITVGAHCNGKWAADSNGNDLPPAKLADMIKNLQKWKDGVRLVILDMCFASRKPRDGSDSYAQRLANELGNNAKLRATPGGFCLSEFRDPVTGEKRVYNHADHAGGDWETVRPQQQPGSNSSTPGKPQQTPGNSPSPSAPTRTPAATGYQGNQPAPIYPGGAIGGGTAWGQQTDGSFVDAQGSNTDLGGDSSPGFAHLVAPVQ
jgi:RHS repeat-associated protein